MVPPSDAGINTVKEAARKWLDENYPPMTEIIKGQDYTAVGFENERQQLAALLAAFRELKL